MKLQRAIEAAQIILTAGSSFVVFVLNSKVAADANSVATRENMMILCKSAIVVIRHATLAHACCLLHYDYLF